MFEKDMHLSLLMDTYGALLSERKRELMSYYYDEDDSVKKSEAELRELEEKLHLAERTQKLTRSLSELSANLARIASDTMEPRIKTALEDVVCSIDKIVL